MKRVKRYLYNDNVNVCLRLAISLFLHGTCRKFVIRFVSYQFITMRVDGNVKKKRHLKITLHNLCLSRLFPLVHFVQSGLKSAHGPDEDK